MPEDNEIHDPKKHTLIMKEFVFKNNEDVLKAIIDMQDEIIIKNEDTWKNKLITSEINAELRFQNLVMQHCEEIDRLSKGIQNVIAVATSLNNTLLKSFKTSVLNLYRTRVEKKSCEAEIHRLHQTLRACLETHG